MDREAGKVLRLAMEGKETGNVLDKSNKSCLREWRRCWWRGGRVAKGNAQERRDGQDW